MPTDERIIMIGDVARGEYRSVRGSAEFIHDDAIIDLKSGLLRKARFRNNPDTDHDEIRREGFASRGDDTRRVNIALYLLDTGVEANIDAV